MTFVSPLDFMPSCTPKGGETPAQKRETDLAGQVITGLSNALRSAHPAGEAPPLEPGAESDAESRILRTLRSAGTPLSTVAAVARASGLDHEVARRSVANLENRRLIRRASSALGGDQLEAVRR
jgi:hypothetical protein